MSNNIDGGKLSIIGAYENGPRSAVDGRKIIARKPPTRKAICISDDLIERAIFFFFFFLYSHDEILYEFGANEGGGLRLGRSEREKKIVVDAVARVEQRFIVLRALSPCFTLFVSVVNSVLYFSFT